LFATDITLHANELLFLTYKLYVFRAGGCFAPHIQTMKNLTCLLAACVLALVFTHANAQININPKFEFAVDGGAFVYHGDLSDNQFGNHKDARPGAGIFVRCYLNPILSLRANAYRGTLHGSDADFREEWRQKRDYEFSSPLTELSLCVEADLFGRKRFESFRDTRKHNHHWGVYIFAGAGTAFTNAKRSWTHLDRTYFYRDAPEKINQDSLNAPGAMSLVVPMGLGARFDISKHVSAFIEAGYRFSFTDNMDGFKYSVFSSKYDGYSIYSAGFSYRLDKDTKRRRQMLIQ